MLDGSIQKPLSQSVAIMNCVDVAEQKLQACLEMMDAAVEAAEDGGTISKTCAFDYRDGLIIALLAVIPCVGAPLQRRVSGKLNIGNRRQWRGCASKNKNARQQDRRHNSPQPVDSRQST